MAPMSPLGLPATAGQPPSIPCHQGVWGAGPPESALQPRALMMPSHIFLASPNSIMVLAR